MQNRQNGFTLIEIMIAVVIVGILAAIAVPQYGSFMRDSRRSDAHVALRAGAQALERCRTENNFNFNGCAAQVPTTTDSGHYTVATSNLAATTYTLTATATGGQANDTACTTIVLNQLGPTNATCW